MNENCAIGLQLKAPQINTINKIIKLYPDTFENIIQKVFPNTANDIINIINKVTSEGRSEVTLNDFESTTESTTQIVNPAVSHTFAAVSPAQAFNNDQTLERRMEQHFKMDMVKATIFDIKENRRIEPNAKDFDFGDVLNRNIHNYKMRLVADISRITKVNYDTSVTSAEDTNRVIQSALIDFSAVRQSLDDKTRNSSVFLNANEAWVILSNFDDLVKKNASYIKIQPGWYNMEADNKYQYVGPTTSLNIVSYKDDDAKANSIEANTSDLATVLLDTWPEYNEKMVPINGTSISQPGFNKVMTAFKSWFNSAPFTDIFDGSSRLSDRSRLLIKKAYEGDIDAIATLFERFYTLASTNSSIWIRSKQFSMNTLRGIKKMLDSHSTLAKEIKQTMWALAFKTESNIANSTGIYKGRLSNKKLQDNYKQDQLYHIRDQVNSMIRYYRFDGLNSTGTYDQPEFKQLCKKFSIKYKYGSTGDIVLFEGRPYEVTIKFDRNGGISANQSKTKVPDSVAEYFIKQLLSIPIPGNYAEIIKDLGGRGNLFDMYSWAIITTLAASINDGEHSYPVPWDKKHGANNPESSAINFTPWYDKFTGLSEFLGVAYGTNVSSVNKNQEGNNVAAYQLTSVIRQVPKLALEIWGGPSYEAQVVYDKNPIYKSLINHDGFIGEPTVRLDVKIGDKLKKARDLTVSEVAYVGIMSDFYNQYFNTSDDSYIELQNTGFADKNTHFCIPYSKKLVILKKGNISYTLGDAIKYVLNPNAGLDGKKIFIDAIIEYRKNYFSKVLDNVFEDYTTVFFPDGLIDDKGNTLKNLKALSVSEKLNIINTLLSQNSLTQIKQAFRAAGIDFLDEVHATKVKGSEFGRFNETLEHSINLYVAGTSDQINDRLNKQKEYFLQDLKDAGLHINQNIDKATITSIITHTKSGEQWLDSITGELLLSKVIDGKEVLNPALEAYFYADVLLSTAYNELLFGHSMYHPNKYTASRIMHESSADNDFEFDANGNIKLDEFGREKYSEDYYVRAEASRLSTSYKRTVIAGATVHSLLPQKYGVDKEMNIAVVEDLQANVFNMMGVQDKVDSHDGAAFASPIHSIMENWSLPGAEAGMDKKTIFGDVNRRYGFPTLLKWATFALTNDRRQMGRDSAYSAENMFKKMHNTEIPINFNIGDYYVSSKDDARTILTDNGRELTHTKDIYRYNADTQKHYLIYNISQNGNEVTWQEIEVNKNGREIGEVINRHRIIHSIYDIDQVLGGAYCEELSSNGVLRFSNANNIICANIVCHRNLKKYIIAFVVNKSAIKVGARNINPTASLAGNNNDDFWSTTVSTQFGGVQMDADMELTEEDVTEMSQMVSALVQNGFYINEVNTIYQEIGNVVLNAIAKQQDFVDSKKWGELRQWLGKELIKDFASGSKNTIGLAQAYLAKAQKELEKYGVIYTLPFSDPGVVGEFRSMIVSGLNRAGIRRRYAGMGAVQVPSRGVIQFYRFGSKDENGKSVPRIYMDSDARKYLSDTIVKNRGISRFSYVMSEEEWEQNKEFVAAKEPAGYDGTYESYVENHTSPLTFYNKYMGTYDPINEKFMLTGEEAHPFINEVDPAYVGMEETVIKVVPGFDPEVIVLDSFAKWDAVRHLTNPDVKIFRWSSKPMNLRPAETTFTINDRNASIYDLYSVRASHYLNEIKDKNGNLDLSKLSVDKRIVIESVLKKRLPLIGIISTQPYENLVQGQINEDLKRIDKGQVLSNLVSNNPTKFRISKYITPANGASLDTIISTSDNIQVLSTLLSQSASTDVLNTYTDINPIVKVALVYAQDKDLYRAILDARYLGILGLHSEGAAELFSLLTYVNPITKDEFQQAYSTSEEEFLNDAPKNVHTRMAEIVMGRLNAQKLGLQESDSIVEIENRGAQFFEERLRPIYNMPSNKVVDRTSYDAVLVGPNKEKLFIALNSKHSQEDLYKQGYKDDNTYFVNRNGQVYYNDHEICNIGYARFYVKESPYGPIHLAVVNSIDDINEFLQSPLYIDIRYNYTENNVFDLAKHTLADTLGEDNIITEETQISRNFDLSVGDDLEKISRNLGAKKLAELFKEGDDERVNRKIKRQAAQRYEAFKQQKYFIGARIPTQSMQSFTGFEVIGFSNSNLNEVYIPATITWLQGSDYDIDKLYLLGFELLQNGRLPITRTYQEGTNSTYVVTVDDVVDAINNKSNKSFNTVIKSGSQVVFAADVTKEQKDTYLTNLNKYVISKLSNPVREATLKNNVAFRMLNLLQKSRNQVAAHKPITVATLQSIAALSTLGGKEKRMCMDNPITKFIMQYQNMVGKDVIGITAVGMKVFFATTSYISQRLKDLKTLLERRLALVDPLEIQLQPIDDAIVEILGDISFNDLWTGDLSTIANINFEEILDLLKNNQIVIPTSRVRPSIFNTLPTQLQSTTIDVNGIISELDRKSKTVDGADAISQLLSAATDNAKELILAKINATVDFADVWIRLITTGHTIEEVADIMTSPIFQIVEKYSKTDVFSDLVKSSSPARALSFVLGDTQLAGFDARSMKLVMGRYPWVDRNKKGATTENDNNCFFNKLKYETYTAAEENPSKGIIRGMLKLRNGQPIPRTTQLLTETQYKEALTKGSDFRKNLFKLLGDTSNEAAIRKATLITSILADHLYYCILQNKPKRASSSDEYEGQESEEFGIEYEPQLEEDMQLEDLEEEELQRKINNNDFGDSEQGDYKVTYKQLVNLYRYVKQYLMPKNEALLALGGSVSAQVANLRRIAETIMPAVEEQQIIGSILGVNQGMRVRLGEFYGVLKRTENFINARVNKSSEFAEEEITEPFNIIRYIESIHSTSPEDQQYAKTWEQRYDRIKSIENPLKLISKVPNFKEMYILNGTAFRMMERSILSRMAIKLSETLLNNPTLRLSADEFSILERYCRDLLIVNFMNSKNIQITIPNVFANNPTTLYEKDTDAPRRWVETYPGNFELTIGNHKPVELNTPQGRATFVRLFENWVVPYMNNKWGNNAFVQMLTRSDLESKTHGVRVNHARIAINMMNVDASEASRQMYSNALEGFNQIANEGLPIGLTVKDAVFLYNMLVYKNAFTQGGFTMFLETSAAQGDNDLVNDWATFISDLDSGKIDVGDLSTENPYSRMIQTDENGNLNMGQIKGNINDLLYRMAFTPNASYKYQVTINRTPSGAVKSLQFVDMFGKPITGKSEIIISVPNANDWCSELPISEKITTEPKSKSKNYKGQQQFDYNSRELLAAIGDQIARIFNVSVGESNSTIQYITTEEVNKAYADFLNRKNDKKIARQNKDFTINSEAEYSRMIGAKGFIHNGKVYLVTNQMSADTMLHEILHLVFAGLKTSPDLNVRKTYYDMLNSVVEELKKDPILYSKLQKRYNSDVASDFKEELLVYYMTNIFTNELKRKSNDKIKDKVTFAINVINDIFGTDIPANTNPAELGNTPLRVIYSLYKSNLLSPNNSLAGVSIVTSQKVKTLKKMLIENAKDPNSKNYIKYDC